MKTPTVLDFGIAEFHAREKLQKKVKEPCACRTCHYVQAFLMKQIQAQMAQHRCQEDCEEE